MFFTDYSEDKCLPSEDALAATKDEILHSMDCVLHMSSNFLGIIDENDTTLQFAVNDDKSIYVDLPEPSKGGSFAKTTDLASALDIVRQLGDQIDSSEIDGLNFEKW